jgi:glycosyltransferase involved in cell wall biosynthesis
MKIIRLTTSLHFGGQEKKYISIGNCKDSISVTYVFACLGNGGYAERNLIEKGFSVKTFNNHPSVYNLKNIVDLYLWLKKERPDIIHTAAGEANFHGIIAAKLAGVKNILAEEIGFPSHSKFARKVFSFLYKFANKVICVSQSVKDYLIKIGEISDEKGEVIYNPVSSPSKLQKQNQSSFTIVSVGRLEKGKNQQLILKALHQLEDKSIQLILVGDGTERGSLDELIHNLNLQERVRITGFVSEPELFLAQADLFVLPSISEGFGIAAVEAMLLGVPCLCSQVGGIPEFVVDGKTGWLFDPENQKEFIDKFHIILKMDKKIRDEIGIKGRESVVERFSEEIYIKNLERLYHKISTGD